MEPDILKISADDDRDYQIAIEMNEQEKRIAALEQELKELNALVGLNELNSENGIERIAALETELKDFGTWGLEILRRIGPRGEGGIEQRIAALEEKQYGWVDKRGHIHVIDPDVEKRITALEQDKDFYAGLAGMFEDLTSRIAALEAKIK